MSKKRLSILFSVIFLLYTIVPTIIIIVDNTVDVSIVFSASEEEEIEVEKKLDIEVVIPTKKNYDQASFSTIAKTYLVYFHKKYTKPHLNIILPPPDTVLV